MLLSRDEKTVILEPKVLEVLLYFIENKDRYITMEDLHSNLWQGRIVSDAAVRRIISKLRILFNDDHKAPKYIKSLSKRGYKLICVVEHTNRDYINKQSIKSSHSHQTHSTHSSVQENNSLFPHETTKEEEHKKYIYPAAVTLILLLLTTSVIYFIFNTNKKITNDVLITSSVLSSLPGDKLTVSQSLDKQFIAFSGKVNQEEGYQVFIKRNNHHNFIPIESSTYFPLSLAFSSDSKYLYYSDLKEGSSSLHIISLITPTYKEKTLLKDYFVISNVFTSPNVELIYFSGKKHKNEPQLIYSYNINTQKIEQVTHSAQDYYYDIKGNISSNGKFLVVERFSEYKKSSDIRVFDLTTNDIVYQRRHENKIVDITWKDNKHLLLLDEKQLLEIDITTDKAQKLINKSHQLAALHIVDKQQILAIEYSKANRIFVEQTLPFKKWENIFIFDVKPEAYDVFHTLDNHSKLIMSYHNGITALSKLNTQTEEYSSYLKTENELDLLEYSSLSKIVLIKINRRFALYELNSKILTYITSADEFIGDASFSIDVKRVLFSVKNHDQWQIKSYNIKNKTSMEILKGFRYIRPYKNDYIVADAQQNLYFYNQSTQEKINLGYRISDEPNTFWFVRKNYIYWSNHDLVDTIFFELNINDIKAPIITRKTFSYDEVRPYFTVKPDGSSLIYSQRELENATIVSLLIK